MEELKNRCAKSRYILLQTRALLILFYTQFCLLLKLFIASIAFSDGRSHKMWCHVQPCLIQSFGISESSLGTSWHCPSFHPGDFGTSRRISPRLPTPSGTSLIRRSERASWANCAKIQTLALEIVWNIKEQETRNVWKILCGNLKPGIWENLLKFLRWFSEEETLFGARTRRFCGNSFWVLRVLL